MFKAYKYRLYPSAAQAVLLNKHIGATRFLYNLALETKQSAYAGNHVNLSRFDLQKQIPDLKQECPWLKEINSQTLQHALACLDTAYKNFFRNTGGFPRYKSKHKRESFCVPQNVIVDQEQELLIVPKFKEGIEVRLHRVIKGEVKQATISKTKTGKYYVSVLVDTKQSIPKKAKISDTTSIGVDLGLKDFLCTSEGEVVNNPRHLKTALNRLRFLQRKYSRYKGNRTKRKLTKQHELVANARRDFLHQLSARLIRENQTICLEDLNVKGMMSRCKPKWSQEENRYLPNGQAAKSGLNRSIADASYGMFTDMLQYKAEWYGRNIIYIGRFEPSSKTCSNCGHINRELTLKDRNWTCEGCGQEHHRDINAAVNIKSFAMNKKYKCVERTQQNHEELPTLVGALTHEARPIAYGVGG
jgi:putative transposase